MLEDNSYLPYVDDKNSIDTVRRLHKNSAAKSGSGFGRTYDDERSRLQESYDNI